MTGGPAPVPLITLPEWLGAPSQAALRQVSTGGLRSEEPLTEAQKAEVTAYAERLGIPPGVLKFSDTMNTAYSPMFGQEVVYVGTDAYPAAAGERANSRISMQGALSHEWVGHRAAAEAGKTQADPLLEEVQASMRAALHGPDLSDDDRATLMQDAQERLDKAGLKLEDVQDKLWLDE